MNSIKKIELTNQSSSHALSFGTPITKQHTDVAFYFLTTFGSLGLILNIVGIAVFRRKRFAKCSMGFYNIVIAFINNSIICVAIWNFVPFHYNINPLVASVASCMLINYLQHWLTCFSSALDMLITVDRMICITFPRRFEYLKIKKNIIKIILILCLITMLANISNFRYGLVETLVNNTSNNSNSMPIKVITCIAKIMSFCP